MSPENVGIQRVLVALDASSPPRAILDAAEMAAALKAEVAGLFLRDPVLRALAEHPATSQITLPQAKVESWDAARLDLELRAVAARAREALSRAAEARNISWTFEVREGDLGAEILRAVRQTDLTAVSIHDPPWRTGRRGEEVRTHMLRFGCEALLLPRETGLDRRRSVVVFTEDTAAGYRALALAQRIASATPTTLRVLIPRTTPEEAVHRTHAALDSETGSSIVLQRIPAASSGSLARFLALFDRDLVVLPGTHRLLRSRAMRELVSSPSSSVLVVR